MRKVYAFSQLPEKAKQVAAKQVSLEAGEEWSVEYQMITEDVEQQIAGEKLEYGKISWSNHYGVSLNLSSFSMTEEYLQKVLTKEEYELYEDLKELSSGYMKSKLFDKDYERLGYVLVFEYSGSGFHEKTGMEFIMKYSKDEELLAAYKLPLLLETKLSFEEYENLEKTLKEMGEGFAEELSGKINDCIAELICKLEDSIEKQCDYLGSLEYYYEQLSDGSHLSEKYLFNYQGEIILEDGEYKNSEYEEMYHSCAS